MEKIPRREFFREIGKIAAEGAVSLLIAEESAARTPETERSKEMTAVLTELFRSMVEVEVDFKGEKQEMSAEMSNFIEECMMLDEYYTIMINRNKDNELFVAEALDGRQKELYKKAPRAFPDLALPPYSPFNWARFVMRTMPQKCAPYKILVIPYEQVIPAGDFVGDMVVIPQFVEIAPDVKTERFSQWEGESFTADIVKVTGPLKINNRTTADVQTVLGWLHCAQTMHNTIVLYNPESLKPVWEAWQAHLRNESPENVLINSLANTDTKEEVRQLALETGHLFIREQILALNGYDIEQIINNVIFKNSLIHEAGHIAANRNRKEKWQEQLSKFSGSTYNEFMRNNINYSAHDEFNAMLCPLRFSYDDTTHEPAYGLSSDIFGVLIKRKADGYNIGHRQGAEWIIDSIVELIAQNPDLYDIHEDENGKISQWILNAIRQKMGENRPQIPKEIIDRFDKESQIILAIPFLAPWHIEKLAEAMHAMQEQNPDKDFSKKYMPKEPKGILTYIPHIGFVSLAVAATVYGAKKFIQRRERMSDARRLEAMLKEIMESGADGVSKVEI